MKNGKNVIKQDVLNKIYQIIDVQLDKDKSMNQLHIHDLHSSFFVLKAQINYMWFKKEFKMNEFLNIVILDTQCTASFDTKCVHHTMGIPIPGCFFVGPSQPTNDVIDLC